MARTSSARTARLEARIRPEQMQLLKRAAELQGRSVSDFVVAAAQDAAAKAIADIEVIRLSRAASEAFAALLINPPEPNAALRRAFKNHRRLIVQR